MTDETNLQESRESKFFIYGGLILPVATAPSLHNALARVRAAHGLRPGDSLKFDTRARPDHVSREQYTSAKIGVVQACIDHQVQLIACLVLHQIARSQTQDTLVERGINTVLGAYHHYMEQRNGTGFVVVDRVPIKSEWGYLKDKFTCGLTGANWERPLHRILMYASSCDGASHLSSAVDVVLGSLRYCINDTTDSSVVPGMLQQVARLMWHEHVNGVVYVRERGLLLRPLEVWVPEYAAQYEALLNRFSRLVPNAPDCHIHESRALPQEPNSATSASADTEWSGANEPAPPARERTRPSCT